MREERTLEEINATWDALTPKEQEEKTENTVLSLSKKERKLLLTMREIYIERMNKEDK